MKFKRKIDYILKHNYLIQNIYKKSISFLFRIVSFFVKTDENLILFVSFMGKSYNDSPRNIYEFMKKEDRFKNFNFVWAFEEPKKFEYLDSEKIKIDTIKYFLTAMKAKYWVSSVNIERGLNFKKKDTIYLNTWHGTPLKKVGNACNGRSDFDYSNVNYMCCSGNYEREIFLRDFNAKKECLLSSGLPRNDELYNASSEDIEYYKKKFNIPKDKKVILYAPTWRDSYDNGINYSIQPPIDTKFWEKMLKKDYIVLLRTHIITNNLIGLKFNDFFRDVSDYYDIGHLYMISDILVSDYSSVFFDFSILKKPMFCFGYDYEEYKLDRGFYLKLEEELPNGVIKNEIELIDKILNIDYKLECEKTKSFSKKYVEFGGNATKTCVNELFKNLLF